jgi:hypothetical protein
LKFIRDPNILTDILLKNSPEGRAYLLKQRAQQAEEHARAVKNEEDALDSLYNMDTYDNDTAPIEDHGGTKSMTDDEIASILSKNGYPATETNIRTFRENNGF